MKHYYKSITEIKKVDRDGAFVSSHYYIKYFNGATKLKKNFAELPKIAQKQVGRHIGIKSIEQSAPDKLGITVYTIIYG